MKFLSEIFRDYYKALKEYQTEKQQEFFSYVYKKLWNKLYREYRNEYDRLNYTQKPDEKEYNILKGLSKLIGHIKFSLVIPLDDPSGREFNKLLESLYLQTCPPFEVIIMGESEELEELKPLFDLYPSLKFNSPPTGDWVVLVDQHSWLRCDYLYRYEAVIAYLKECKTVLHCYAAKIDKADLLIPGIMQARSHKPNFPYEFYKFKLHGLAMPVFFWKEFYERDKDLYTLDVLGANFELIPVPLIAERPYIKDFSESDILANFTNYVKKKGLNWQVSKGIFSGSVRGLPQLKDKPKIQVVLPFKDQKQMTLAAVESLLNSTDVEVSITAMDNGSEDHEIGRLLEEKGCEVIRVDEPFNYSRLNNLAVKMTVRPQPLILFMNNDVELDPGALYEMARWTSQPKIGIVGCRLHYPSGEIQHMGVALSQNLGYPGALWWTHPGYITPLESNLMAQVPRIVDAVTAAAAMITKEHFLSVGGFEEVLYPIAYSDTNLAIKLYNKGLLAFYTPYASGVHHESRSRPQGALEDFDRSLFLHELTSRGFENRFPIH